MPTFERSIHLPASIDDAFAWHEAEGALERLTPPWEPVEVESRTGGLADGARATLKLKIGPIGLRWLAEHCGYDPPNKFEDRQISGPFAAWHHKHLFAARDESTSVLTDSIEYRVPLGPIGQFFGGWLVRSKLDRMFAYRQQITHDDLAFHGKLASSTKKPTVPKRRIAVTGASGLVGSTLVPILTTGGHEVIRLTRSQSSASNVRTWDPSAATLDPTLFEDCHAVIHLAGESVMGRWTDDKKQRIRDSRIGPTTALAKTLAQIPDGPTTLVVASAVGIYGNRGDESLDEESSLGSGFLADVAREWEAATEVAREAGIRVVHVRLGIVISREGGALANMLLPFQVGAGGVVGSGEQYWSWIAIDDAASIFAWAALDESVEGAVNATAPRPTTNREFTKTLAGVLHRPSLIPIPKFGVKLVFGEMGEAILLDSTRAVPKRTQELGYRFRFDDLEEALRHELGRQD